MITLHPLPTHGGFMDSHVYRKASYRLPALAGVAVLRFNTRGTQSPRGTSDGQFEEGVGERYDVEAAVRFAVDRGLPNRWLVGWSFGTELALMYGAVEPVASQIQGAVLLSPPLHRATDVHLKEWASSGKPLTVLVPEHDDYLQPAEAAQRFSLVPQAGWSASTAQSTSGWARSTRRASWMKSSTTSLQQVPAWTACPDSGRGRSRASDPVASA